MLKNAFLLLFFLFLNGISAQITLTHNIGNTPIKTDMTSCQYEASWARAFTLADFGISSADQFIITSGQVAISNSYENAKLIFNFYSLDSETPGANPKRISYGNLVFAPAIGDTPEIVEINFGTPITIPAGVERILVEVTQGDDIYNDDFKKVLIAGTEFDNDTSWFKGCREYYTHIPTENLSTPVPNANFFINVTGQINSHSTFGSRTTLTHNLCGDLVRTSMFSCSYSKLYWARLFSLEDFGVSTNEEFTIDFGQIGIGSSDGGSGIQFNIYEVDDNFPSSFSETNLIGSSQVHRLPPISHYDPQIVTVNFDTPVTVPSHVRKILVEVTNVITWGSGVFFVAGTEEDVGDSWYRGCGSGSPGYSMANYVTMVDPSFAKPGGYPDAKFYINVNGNVNHVTNNFDMSISNDCSDFLKEFSIIPAANMTSVQWNFGDPASGAANTSSDFSPYHDFSADGTYTITATVTASDGSTELLTETITTKEPPHAYGIDNINACEDSFGTGISSSFDVTNVTRQVLGGQNNMTVTFFDGSGNEYTTLPNPFTNTIRDRETIKVRVSHSNNLCCYSETTFDLIANPVPDLSLAQDLIVCSNEANGFATFDLEQLKDQILNGNNALSVSFYRQNGNQIQPPMDAVENEVVDEEVITVQAFDNVNNCYHETTFKLIVNPLPVAYEIDFLIGCDDNNDGISEYFDTSAIEAQVLGNQMNMAVSYFDANGNPLPSPLPNPYTNTVVNEETITVRVTNTQTSCFDETPLVLRTSSQPQLNTPNTVYICDAGNGFGRFDLSHIESEIVGNQAGLNMTYFDADGNVIPNSALASYENTMAWKQTIFVRAENALNNLCYAETSFDLVVLEPLTVTLEASYFLCHLEPLLPIQVASGFDFYSWAYEDNSIVSNTPEVDLINDGNYTLTVGKNMNGIYCQKTFDFELVRSSPPSITEVRHSGISESNFIEIIASGDGDFEYSLDGINFQENNRFSNIPGGNYTAIVRDKDGCGEDREDVSLIDYPRFFTPNGDGHNDYWHISGIEGFPNSRTFIFDRYGKYLVELSSNDIGWDGFYNGREMVASDYWFKTDLGDGVTFSGHFALKR